MSSRQRSKAGAGTTAPWGTAGSTDGFYQCTSVVYRLILSTKTVEHAAKGVTVDIASMDTKSDDAPSELVHD